MPGIGKSSAAGASAPSAGETLRSARRIILSSRSAGVGIQPSCRVRGSLLLSVSCSRSYIGYVIFTRFAGLSRMCHRSFHHGCPHACRAVGANRADMTNATTIDTSDLVFTVSSLESYVSLPHSLHVRRLPDAVERFMLRPVQAHHEIEWAVQRRQRGRARRVWFFV